jgi:hypothetical protein
MSLKNNLKELASKFGYAIGKKGIFIENWEKNPVCDKDLEDIRAQVAQIIDEMGLEWDYEQKRVVKKRSK